MTFTARYEIVFPLMHLVTSSFSESMRCVLKCETSQVETVADTSLNDMPVYGVQRAIFSIK